MHHCELRGVFNHIITLKLITNQTFTPGRGISIMKFSIGNNKNAESVNLTPEDVEEARRLEDDPELMLRLVDLIFGFDFPKWPAS